MLVEPIDKFLPMSPKSLSGSGSIRSTLSSKSSPVQVHKMSSSKRHKNQTQPQSTDESPGMVEVPTASGKMLIRRVSLRNISFQRSNSAKDEGSSPKGPPKGVQRGHTSKEKTREVFKRSNSQGSSSTKSSTIPNDVNAYGTVRRKFRMSIKLESTTTSSKEADTITDVPFQREQRDPSTSPRSVRGYYSTNQYLAIFLIYP